VGLGVALVLIYFSVRYRRRRDEVGPPPETHTSEALEWFWTITPCFPFAVMFIWGASIYLDAYHAPPDATPIYVVAKQWMWKFQHPEGPREINMLHVPMGRPVKLLMTSQDVIHDFGIPAFRIKQDVVPGSYSTEWFIADRVGEYHFFCDQYCGDLHSRMIGTVVVMEPAAYQAWLAGAIPDQPPAVIGAQLYQSYGCAACHGVRAPTLAGLYMSKVVLDNGRTVIADDTYLHESIVEPAAKLVAGYGPIMPTFKGQLSEEQIFDLIEYIKSLGAARNNAMLGANPGGVEKRATTQPVNSERPDLLPNEPPARVPPTYDQTGRSPERQ
jgi:cytochrome c oxidase subunit 2